jgi:Collagen triple helix repeat (20 copies)
MHKSALTFGLLASSLVMLVIMPFLNQNNSFSNLVMAQEYDKYRDSSYSQYPTDDKKYECRTGSFEGFFVSSVEFCKFKFDDRKDNNRDNRTGTQGPPGPAGATGPQGERGLTGTTGPASTVPGPQGERGFNGTDGVNGTQGPPGVSQINSSNYYVLTGPLGTIPQGSLGASSFMICDPGDVAINGWFETGNVGVEFPTVAFFGGNGITPTGWTTNIVGTVGQTVRTYVGCFDNSPPH